MIRKLLNDLERRGITLTPAQRAALYVYEWQGQCCRGACAGECVLPKVWEIEVGARVGHGTAQRARNEARELPCPKCSVRNDKDAA